MSQTQGHCPYPDHCLHAMMRRCQWVRTAAGEFQAERSDGFDKGRWPVRCLSDRAGFWPARVSPIWAIARVPLSNPPRPWNFWAVAARRYFCFSREPTGVGAAVAGAEACVPCRRRERPGAALKTYRKFSHGRASPPVHGDRGEQPVFYFVPFAGSRWQVQHGDVQAGFCGEGGQFGLPQPQP